MFTVEKSGIFDLERLGREICKITTQTRNEVGNSVYMLDVNSHDVERKSIESHSESSDIDMERLRGILEELKSKLGRIGRRIRRSDINNLANYIKEIQSTTAAAPIDLENFMIRNDPLSITWPDGYIRSNEDLRLEECKILHEKYKEYLRNQAKIRLSYGKFHLTEEEIKNGAFLQPLPITNINNKTKEEILKGKTIFLCKGEITRGELPPSSPSKVLKDSMSFRWELREIIGNVEDELKELQLEELKEDPSGRNLSCIIDLSILSEEDQKTIRDKYLGDGGKVGKTLGFHTYKPTGEEMIEISYIYGPNRSGKSYYAAKYAQEWSDSFKEWPIYLFSRRDKDKVLDDLKMLKRVQIDERMVTDPLEMTDFEKSLVIFDDIDTICDKKICAAVQKLRDDIMETGRQKMIYVINTSHLGMNWKPTRTVLNEANSYTLFPRRGNYEHNFKILKDKMGLKTETIRKIIDSPDGIAYQGKWGWITIYKDSPQYLIYENGIILL